MQCNVEWISFGICHILYLFIYDTISFNYQTKTTNYHKYFSWQERTKKGHETAYTQKKNIYWNNITNSKATEKMTKIDIILFLCLLYLSFSVSRLPLSISLSFSLLLIYFPSPNCQCQGNRKITHTYTKQTYSQSQKFIRHVSAYESNDETFKKKKKAKKTTTTQTKTTKDVHFTHITYWYYYTDDRMILVILIEVYTNQCKSHIITRIILTTSPSIDIYISHITTKDNKKSHQQIAVIFVCSTRFTLNCFCFFPFVHQEPNNIFVLI